MSEEPIFTLAWDCDNLLQECLGKVGGGTIIKKDIIEDYERRFRAWQEYLGVFAERRDNLDRRLRKQPEIRDIVARLLIILRRNLDQIREFQNIISNPTIQSSDGTAQNPKLGSEIINEKTSSDETSPFIAYSCGAIDEALTELSRVAVAIRKSSRTSETIRARQYASEHLDLSSLETLSILALESLYPNSPESLILQLGQSMVDRCSRLLFRAFRHKQLKVDVRPIPQPQNYTAHLDLSGIAPIEYYSFEIPMVTITQNLINSNTGHMTPTMTSAHWSRFQEQLEVTRTSKSRFGTTVILAQKHEPSIPWSTNDLEQQCPWCFTCIDQELTKDGRWTASGRAHYCKDLEPFCCISEECAETNPSFPSIKQWRKHMVKHRPNWAQYAHFQRMWQCDLPDVHDSNALFSTPNELRSHLKALHKSVWNELDDEDITSIISESMVEILPDPNICPLCRMIPKGMESSEFSSDDSTPTPAEMEQHIAEHLQKIMVISLRLLETVKPMEGSDDESGGSVTVVESHEHSLTQAFEGGLGSESSSEFHSHSDGPSHLEFGSPNNSRPVSPSTAGYESHETVAQDWSSIVENLLQKRSDLDDPENDLILGHFRAKQRTKVNEDPVSEKPEPRTAYSYTIGWICDNTDSFNEAHFALDEVHTDTPEPLGFKSIFWSYSFGRIGKHNVVIALPRFSYTSIGSLAVHFRSRFPALRVWFIVGSGSVAFKFPENDIRLGDVVVGLSAPGLGEYPPNNQRSATTTIGYTAKSWMSDELPSFLRDFLGKVLVTSGPKISTTEFLTAVHKGQLSNVEYKIPDCKHIPDLSAPPHCALCGQPQEVEHSNRYNGNLAIHYGRLGYTDSINPYHSKIQHHASWENTEDKEKMDVICAGLDAADFQDGYPFLIVRGIRDYYYDTSLDDQYGWRRFAELAAAAYTRALINTLEPASLIEHRERAKEYIQTMNRELKIVADIRAPVNRLIDYELESSKLLTPKLRGACLGWVHHLSECGYVVEDYDWIHDFLDENARLWVSVVEALKVCSLSQIQLLRSMVSKDHGLIVLDILQKTETFILRKELD